VLDCTGCENLSSPTHQWTRERCWIVNYVGSHILYNPTHVLGPLVCRIRQVLTSCTIQHISLVPWCVGLDRFHCSKIVETEAVLDCTGCQNLSNPTHQWTREMCQIVHDVRTCLIRHTRGPGKCVGLYRMSEPV
jgi:hypothetical protein